MSKTGRYTVIDLKTGKRVTVEPVDDKKKRSRSWGDINPATKTVGGNYGTNSGGSVEPKDSIITKENGFNNINETAVGESPTDIINKKLNKEE